ncbi:hypothetical protein F5B20DRAFT_283208 [Whalleya microplaca]|nr:hypothetical protein F5B20DRAFT_283208 [Whalleya microplaca]
MSFGVAVQSAIFYVVSCAPCLQARHHHQSKVRAKKEREEKSRLQAEYPGSYQHPDPFNTNPYWSEEIMMGPHIESKKYNGGASKNTSQKRLNSSGKETASVAGSTLGGESTVPGSSPTVVGDDGKLSFSTTMSTTLSDDWNRKRYQREDEELWGDGSPRTGHKLMDAIKHAGSSAGRLLEASLGMEHKEITEEDRHNFYFAPKNPPVNDYHPPIVRQRPTHRDANKWMLQPPPAAKIMEGKVPVSRSPSMASHLSRRTTISDGPDLGRLIHERTVEAKLKSGELPADFGSTPTLTVPAVSRKNTTSTHRRQSQRTKRRSLSLESAEAADELKKRRKPRTRFPVTPTYDSSSEEEYVLTSKDSFGPGKGAARRPKLQSILSSQESEQGSKESVSAKVADDQASTRSANSPLANISNYPTRAELAQTAANMAPDGEKPQGQSNLAPAVSV